MPSPTFAQSSFGLNDSVIEAETVRRSSRELESVDRLLRSLEARRDNVLGCIANYRERFASELREASDRLIEAQPIDVPRLQDDSVKTSPERTMASERQFAANRRNAQKSTGPRTRAGKTRASGNAYHHEIALSSRPITCRGNGRWRATARLQSHLNSLTSPLKQM